MSGNHGYVMGIDCGTQSAKVVIYNEVGTVIGQGRQPLRPMSRPHHGVVVHPDDDLWTSIGAASREAIRDFENTGRAASQIAAVGICPIRCCKAFLDSRGELIEPLMSWMDDRAYQPYIPTDSRLAFVTTASGYIAHRFTGAAKDTAANNIAMQWPIDGDTWQWSTDPEVMASFKLTPNQLFALQMPGETIGVVTAAAANETGIPMGTSVVATANDKAVEMLGAGSVADNAALVSLGTYIAAMIPGSKYHREPANFWTNFSSIPNRYLYESNGVRRGMWTLTWLLDLLGPEYGERAASEGVSREEYLEREASKVPGGSDGLMTVLDWLAPTDKPFRKGAMLGFDARHSRGHIYRSILEAIALTMKSHVDSMCAELRTELSELVISGGGSTSPLFMQIFADVFQIPSARSNHGGASLGAAMCAAAAVGMHSTIEAAAAAMASPRETFLPDPANGAIYQQMLETVYLDIRTSTDPIFERSFPLFR